VAYIIKVARKGKVRHAWKVRYRDPDRREVAKTFSTKVEAERFAAGIETDKARGEYVDPRAGRILFRDWAGEWLGSAGHLKPKARAGYESLLRYHLIPTFGDRQLVKVRPVDCGSSFLT
jgi:Phage integrase, N-terminal SAM-like domain